MTRIEVEQKFAVDSLADVEAKLAAFGCGPSAPRQEVDRYYRHPSRDFAKTDEALRIRRVGDSGSITYKGPKLDRHTKTRREIDLPLALSAGGIDAWFALLESLGFTPVAEVRKRRRKVFVDWQERRIEVSLDEVDEVGVFVELELVTTEDDVAAAQSCIASLAARLELSANQRQSYLELLLERRSRP